jgi:hypothetical protein
MMNSKTLGVLLEREDAVKKSAQWIAAKKCQGGQRQTPDRRLKETVMLKWGVAPVVPISR